MKAQVNFDALGGGSNIVDVDFIKNVVANNTHTYEFEPTASNVATLNEGGIYVDTENHVVYLYADFDFIKASTPASGGWNGIFRIPTLTDNSIFPMAGISSNPLKVKQEVIPSGKTQTIQVGYVSPTYFLGNVNATSIGEHYVVYAIWSYK